MGETETVVIGTFSKSDLETLICQTRDEELRKRLLGWYEILLQPNWTEVAVEARRLVVYIEWRKV